MLTPQNLTLPHPALAPLPCFAPQQETSLFPPLACLPSEALLSASINEDEEDVPRKRKTISMTRKKRKTRTTTKTRMTTKRTTESSRTTRKRRRTRTMTTKRMRRTTPTPTP